MEKYYILTDYRRVGTIIKKDDEGITYRYMFGKGGWTYYSILEYEWGDNDLCYEIKEIPEDMLPELIKSKEAELNKFLGRINNMAAFKNIKLEVEYTNDLIMDVINSIAYLIKKDFPQIILDNELPEGLIVSARRGCF